MAARRLRARSTPSDKHSGFGAEKFLPSTCRLVGEMTDAKSTQRAYARSVAIMALIDGSTSAVSTHRRDVLQPVPKTIEVGKRHGGR